MGWDSDSDGALDIVKAIRARYKAEGVKTVANIKVLLSAEEMYSSAEDYVSQARNILNIAGSIIGTLMVGVPAGLLGPNGEPPAWLDKIEHGLQILAVGGPYLLSFMPLDMEPQEEDIIVRWDILETSVFKIRPELRRTLDEADNALAQGRENLARLKSKEIDMVIDDERYVRVREEMLERGDTVYEIVAYGQDLVKYVEAKVIRALRGAAEIRFLHDGRCVRVSFKRLALDRAIWAGRFPEEARKEEAAKLAAAARESVQLAVGDSMRKDARYMGQITPPKNNVHQLPALQTPSEAKEEEFDAWKSMGKGFFEGLEKERTAIKKGLAEVESMLKALDDQSKKEIEELETEIREAKRRHVEARAAVAGRVDAGQRKLKAIDARYNLLKPLMEHGGESDE